MANHSCIFFLLIFRLLVSKSSEGSFLPPFKSDIPGALHKPDGMVLFFITPTHFEHTQMVDLTRVGQFLQLSSLLYHHNIYWIVVEDSANGCSLRIRELLQRTSLPFAHLYCPSDVMRPEAKYGFRANKGINQRNHALEYIETVYYEKSSLPSDGVVYFADSDNAYDVRLVNELIQTTAVSVFPVGFTAQRLYERCVVDETSGKIKGFVGWKGGRKFPVDMAGFAVSLKRLLKISPRFKQTIRIGRLETHFLSKLVPSVDSLQPLASNCTKVYVWHTKTDPRIPKDAEELNPGDSEIWYKKLKFEV